MTSVTPNKEKFGEVVYRMAAERCESPEGKEELKGYNPEQFLKTLKGFTDHIDSLPGEYSINILYLVLNYLGSMVVHIMEENKREMLKQVGAKQ